MLRFLSQWLTLDPVRLGPSLEQFVGHPAYGLTQLRADLDALPSCSAAMASTASQMATAMAPDMRSDSLTGARP